MATKSRAKNTLFNTAAGVAARGATIITGFVMRSVLIRLLGIEYASVSSLFTDVLSALSLAELGISTAITYAMYKPVAQSDYKKIAMLMDVYKKAYRIVAAVVMTAGLALIPALPYIVKDVPHITESIIAIYILYVLNSAISYLLIYKTVLLTAHQEQRYVSMAQTITSLIKLVLGIGILLIFRSYIAYLVSEIILTRVQNWVVSWYAGRRYPEANVLPETPLPKEERRALFKDVRALMLYKISQALLRSVDSVIISIMFGTVQVGLMGNYALVTKNVNKLVNQFYNSASPSIGNLSAESDADKQYKTFRVLQFMAFWICCFCFTAFVVLLNPFVDLWLGDGFTMGMQVVLSMSFVFYINAIVHPVTTFRTTNGLFVQGKYRPVVMLIINVGLSVVLAIVLGRDDPEWGVFGVKLATAVAQIVTLQWYDPWLVYKNVFKRSVWLYYRTFCIQLAVSMAACGVTYALGELVAVGSAYVAFIIKMALCVTVPNLAVIAIYGRTSEYKDFLRILKGLLKRKAKKTAGELPAK